MDEIDSLIDQEGGPAACRARIMKQLPAARASVAIDDAIDAIDRQAEKPDNLAELNNLVREARDCLTKIMAFPERSPEIHGALADCAVEKTETVLALLDK